MRFISSNGLTEDGTIIYREGVPAVRRAPLNNCVQWRPFEKPAE